MPCFNRSFHFSESVDNASPYIRKRRFLCGSFRLPYMLQPIRQNRIIWDNFPAIDARDLFDDMLMRYFMKG
eukprot:1849255-Amphidinium_carterae.1